MNIKDILADSHLAFLNQENETALKLAKEAIKLEPNNSNAYKCAPMPVCRWNVMTRQLRTTVLL